MSVVALLLAASATALVFARLGVPGGLVVGAMVGAGGYSLLRGGAEIALPGPLRSAALIVLGASIGASVTRNTIDELRGVLLPAVLAAVLIIVAGVAIAYLLRSLGLAPEGALLATSPGALTSVVATAAERGTGAAEVAVFHTVRIVLVMLSLPALLVLLPDGGG